MFCINYQFFCVESCCKKCRVWYRTQLVHSHDVYVCTRARVMHACKALHVYRYVHVLESTTITTVHMTLSYRNRPALSSAARTYTTHAPARTS